MKIKILQRGSIAPVVHHLRPLITYSSPSRSMRALMLVASDDATSGSVIAKAERISPASNGSSQRFLFGRAVAHEHFHVARVGGGTVENFRPIAVRPMISQSGA
jgi:hypothetical protein